jgi:hypothetical protein
MIPIVYGRAFADETPRQRAQRVAAIIQRTTAK